MKKASEKLGEKKHFAASCSLGEADELTSGPTNKLKFISVLASEGLEEARTNFRKLLNFSRENFLQKVWWGDGSVASSAL